jgi:hypothetical protein
MADGELTAHQRSAKDIKKIADDFANDPSGVSTVDAQDDAPRTQQLRVARAKHRSAPAYKLPPELQALVDADARQKEEEKLKSAPDRAHKIEEEARRATGGDELAKLEVRQDLEDLMHDSNTAYRDNVLGQVVDDGNHLFNRAPKAKLLYKDGKLDAIDFGGGLTAEHVRPSLSESVAQQRDDAWKSYEQTMEDARLAHGENVQLITDRDDLKAKGVQHPPTIGEKKWFEY